MHLGQSGENITEQAPIDKSLCTVERYNFAIYRNVFYPLSSRPTGD